MKCLVILIAWTLLIAMPNPVAQAAVASEWGERHYDFGKPETAAQLELFGGAKLAGGLLVCDGIKAGATLRGSGDLNYTNRGLSVAGVIRMDSKAPSANDMMIVFKPRGWFFGRTGNAGNLSFTTAERSWDEALSGGEFPALGGWVHFAVVFERIQNREPAPDHLKGTVYLNGEPAAQRIFQNKRPAQNDQPVIVGNCGFPEYGFKGGIARLDFFPWALKPAEVLKFAQSSPRVKVARPGWFQPNRADVEKLVSLEAVAHSPEEQWLLRTLRRAEDFGADSGRMAAVIEATTSLPREDRSRTAFAERWNRSQTEFTLVESKEALLLTARADGRRIPPVLGMLDRATGREVFADRPITWQLRSELEEFADYGPGTSFTISDVKPGADGVDFTVTWKRRKLTVVSHVAFHGPRLAFDLAVENGDSQLRLVEAVFPKVALAKLRGRSDELVFPYCSGTIVRNPTAAAHFSDIWPSLGVTMQFVGYYDSEKHGVYLALEDAEPIEKRVTVLGKNETIVGEYATRIGWKAGATGGNGFRTTGPAVVELYRGDWFEAGQVYKRFLLAKARWYPKTLPRTSTPQWYARLFQYLRYAAAAGLQDARAEAALPLGGIERQRRRDRQGSPLCVAAYRRPDHDRVLEYRRRTDDDRADPSFRRQDCRLPRGMRQGRLHRAGIAAAGGRVGTVSGTGVVRR